MEEANPDWRDYEREIHDEVVCKYPDASVTHDVRLPGVLSSSQRQIDVLIEERVHGHAVRTAIDAKYHGRPIDVKQVEAFIGLLHDVEVDRGIMICPTSFSNAALTRALRDDVDLDLDIFTLDGFKQWQVAGAIPYAERTAVAIPAPLGWVIEMGPVGSVLARLYRRGQNYDQAYDAGEFMYVNIWDRNHEVSNLELLLQKQERDILQSFPDAMISVCDFASRTDCRTCLRRAEIPSYPSAEFTGLVEFLHGILYVVLFTPLLVERRNLRKLEYFLRKAVPMTVQV